MNKLRYRIVFNKTRGMCMAVPETARSHTQGPGQGAAGTSASGVMRMPRLRRMAFMLGVGLAGAAFADGALAQIVADPNAPGSQRATVLNAANGVVQVNIQTPSAAGVSRNVYSQFDVPKSGAILNNSRTNVQTQLGGWVQGNPWLGTGTARVILNEVNSSNPSRVQGYIEVAGDRAETIIANPAGIVVDGGGFINVSRATLTTGSPMLEDGRLKGYSVQRGQIIIDGAGLDASKTDYTALIARSLQVNAGLWAQRLNVITGVNEVEEAAQAAVAQAGQAADAPPVYAVDVARLGGMYANHIYLVGTEAGVGVRNAGAIGAAAGDIVVTASGRLENSGTLSATRTMQASVTGIENQGRMQAGETLALTAGSMVNAGQLTSGREALITVQGEIDNSHGRIEAARIDLTAATLRNNQGSIVQTGTQGIAIEAVDVINTAGTLGQQSVVTATDTTTTVDGNAGSPAGAGASSGTGSAPGQTTAQDSTSADTGMPSTFTPAPILADGRLQVGLLDNTSGVITANGEAVLRTGDLDNRGGQTFLGSLAVSGSTFDNTGGALTVVRTFDAQTERFINDQGTLLVGAAFNGALGAFSNRQGLLQAPHLSVNVTGQLDNSGGTLRHFGTAATALVVGGELALDKGVLDMAGALRLQVGAISGSGSTVNIAGDLVVDSGVTSTAQGRWTIGGSAILHAGALDNSGGAIHVGQSLDLVSGALTNASGTIVSDADASISASGAVDNGGGTIQAAHDLVLKSSDVILNRAGSIGALAGTSTLSVAGAVIDNGDGRIANAGTGRTVLTADSISSRGLIGGNGDVGLTTHTLHNEVGGAVASQGDLELVVDTAVANAGRLDAGGHLRMVQAAAQLSNSGMMAAQGDIEIAVASIDNSLGILATAAGSGSRLLLTAGSLENQAGAIQADGAATLAIQGGVGNEGGHIGAGGGLSLDAAGRIENRAGSIESAERMQLHAADIGNDGGRIAAAGTQTSVIEADRTIENNGLIGANGQLTLRTQTLDSGVAGTISSVGDLELVVSSALANRGGSINTAGTLNFDQKQATLVNSGALTAGAGVRLNIDQIDNRGGSINSLQGAGLELHANMLDNRGGRLMAGSDMSVQLRGYADNGAGVLQAAGSLSVAAGGTLHNQDGVIEALGEHGTLAVHATAIDNTAGRIINFGDGTFNLSAAGHIASSGLIAGNGRLELSAASLGNAGTISSAGGLYAGQPDMALRNSGIIVSGGLLEMALGTIDNAGGRIATAQGSGADLLLTAQSIGNQGGAITGDRDLTLNVAKDVDGRAGLAQARGGLQLSAGGLVDVSGGGIETLSTNSSLQLRAGALLNEAGRIVNAGTGDTRVQTDTTLVNSGQIAGGGVLGVEAPSLTNQSGGSIAAAGALALQVHAALDNAGTISSAAGLTMDEGAAALSNHGTIVAAGDIALRAGAIDNDGGTLATANGSGAGLLLDAASVSNRGGAILSDRDAQVSSAAAFDNTGGTLQAAGSLRLSAAGVAGNHGGVIETLGPVATLSVHAGLLDNGSGRIVNVGSGATSVTVDGRLASHGLVAGNGSLDVAVRELDNQADGSIVSGNTLRIDATQGISNAGAISSQGALTLDATYGSVANRGTIIAGGGATIDAARFDNDGGQLVTTVGGHGDITLDSGDMSNVGGTILADGSFRISAGGTIDNRQGTVRANTALAINAAGALGNQDGVIEAADASAILDVRARSIDNSAGRLANVGNGSTSILATDDIINSGTLAGNGSVALSASSLRNQAGGTIGAGAALDLNVTQELDNTGKISAGAELNMDQAGARIANSGGMVAAGALALHAAAIANDGGQIATLSGAGIALSSESTLSNRAGLIAAAGDASLGAQGAFDNTQGQVQTPGHLRVSVGGALTNVGGTLETVGAASTLTLQAAAIGNTGGRIVNAGSGRTSVDSTSDIVNSGTIGGNGALTISARDVQNASDGTIVAGTTLDLALSELIENAGTISSGAALHADLGAGTFKNTGRIDAAGDIGIAAGSLDNTGGTVSADGLLRVAAGDSVSNDGGILHGGTGATLDAGGRLANGSGTIEAATGSLALQARSIGSSGRVVNAGTDATALLATEAIVNSGTIAGNGALVLAGQTLRNADSGVIGSGADFELAVLQQLDNAGTLSSGGTLRFDQGAADFGNSGRIGARGSIDITAATIGNEGGELYTVGQSGTAITMRAQSLDNIGGTVSADGLLRAETADGVANSGGNLHGGTGVALSVAGSLHNGSGTIESAAGALDIQVGSIDSSGRIVNAGTGQTTIATTMDIVNSGTIGGNGALALSAHALQNTDGGTIASGAAMDLAVRRQLDNAGSISSGTSLHVGQGAASLSNTGRIEAGGLVDITAATLANRGGQLYTVAGSGAAVNLGTGSLNNTGGTISADGLLQADVAGGIANDRGTLHGGTGATLQADGVLVNGGGVIESADGALDIRAHSIDSSGRIVNVGTGETTIIGSTDLVNGGTVAVNGKLALSAQAMANTGAISAGSAIDITAVTASNRGGQLYTASQSGAMIQVNAGSLDNTDGTVSADGLLAVVASETIANGGGTLHGVTGVIVDAGAALANGSGTIESAAGTLDIRARAIGSSGRIVNAGTGQTMIGSTTGIVNAGTFAGNGALWIEAASLRNTGSGTIGSGAGVELAVREWLDNAGTISSAGTLRFDQAAASFGNTGRIGAGGSIDITTATFANRDGLLYTLNGSGASIRLQAGSLDNTGGTVSADSLLRAEVAGAVANDGGTLHGGTGTTLVAGGALGNGSGTIGAAAGALELHAAAVDSSGRIVNAGTGTTAIGSASSIMNGGTIAGNGALTLAAQTLENTGGATIGSGADLELAVHQRLDNAGTISSAGTLRFDQTAANFGNSGTIGAGGTIDITAASIANRGGQLVTAQGSGAAITLATGSLDNMGGTAFADGLLGVLVSGNTVNSGGTLHGGTGTLLNAGGTLANASGTIEAAMGTLQLQATSIDNMAGRIVNAGSGATSIGSATDIDNSGTIAGNGELMLSARTLRNTGSGALSSGTAMELAVRQQVVNAGSISGGGSLHVDQAAARFENTGRIGAGGSIDITAATIDNVGGQIYTSNGLGASIGLHTGGLNNSGGTVAAGGMLLAQVGGAAVNSGGVLHAGTGAALDVSGALANGSGTIETAAGTLEIHAASIESDGRIVNAGTGGMRIDSTTSIVNGGTIASNGVLAVAAETLQNATGGAIGTGSGAPLELAVRQQLGNAGTISSGGDLHVDQTAANVINPGRIGAAGNIDITANTVNNAGGQLYTVSQSGAVIGLRTGSLDNTGGSIAADGQLGIEAGGDVVNNAGILHGGTGMALDTGGALANGSGTIEALSGALQIKARSIDSSGRIVNAGAGASSIDSIDAILNGGTIGGNGTLDLHASALQNQGGQITSAGDLLLDAHQMLLNTGTISSGGTLTFNQAGASFANSGQIAAASDIRLTAASFDNNGGRISTVRGSGGDVTLTSSSLSNQGGAILADGGAILSIAGPVDNSQGVLQAGANLTLSTNGNIGNDGGVIEALGAGSTLSLEGAAIDNGSGQISNAGTGDTRLLAQVSINNGGAIAGMGNLLLSGQTLANAAGATLASGNNLTLAVSQQLGNQGQVNSAGMLTFDQAAATFTNSGEVYSGANAVIHARAVNNDGGRLGTGSGTEASLALTSDLLSNQGGRIATDGDLVVDTHTVSALGELFGGRDLALSMDGDFVQSGVQHFRSNRNLSLSVTGSIHNFSTLETAGTLTLSGQDISNRVGASIEGRAVVLRTSGNLSNGGEINGQDTLDISATAIGNTSGMVGGNVTLATGRLDNVGSAALIGATGTLDLSVAGALYNTGGATLYSSGDMLIGGRYGGSAEEVHNISSTIEAAGNLTLNAGSLSNVRENVQIVQVKTVDETVHMTMPSWFQYGDNHNSFETSAANYRPHEVYFVSPSDILEDEVYWTPDGNKIHRAVIRTHANDSAFQVASTGLYSAYGEQSRLTLSEGTRVIYYTESAQVANPDQGGAASNAVVYANTVTNWTSTVSFSNQYGNCSSDCIRLITQPGFIDPRTTRILDDLRALAPVKEQLEVALDAHHVAVDDQLAPGAGANAQILSGGDMHLTVGSALENRFGDIKAGGSLVIDGAAVISNVGATLYRTHTFDGTWRTYGGQTVYYQRPTISESVGSIAGVIEGRQGVSITGRSFSNIDITAGTVGNIQDAVNVIGSGLSGASSAGAQLAAAASDGSTAGLQVAAGNGSNAEAGTKVAAGSGDASVFGTFVSAARGIDGKVGTDVQAAAGIGGAVGTRAEADGRTSGTQALAGAGLQRSTSTLFSAGTRADGTVDVRAVAGGAADAAGIGRLSGSAMDAGPGLRGAIASTDSGGGLGAAVHAAASGVSNQLRAGEEVASGIGTAIDVINGVALNGAQQQSGTVNDGRLGGMVAATRNDTRLGNVLMTGNPSASQQAGSVQNAALGSVVKVNPGGLFLRNPDANGNYLFETRPQFANQQQWTSSDYLLKQLAFDPATTQKRLGDGFYEQRLVREQLAELTGHTLYGGANDDSTYKELLTNAVSVAREFGLRPGVALSADQVSRLTSDIVWVESQTVMLPDGSTETVLVPKVYLAHVGEHVLQPGGALVTGNGVTINTTESIVNAGGLIDGSNGRTLLVAAHDIVNQGGSIKGESVALAAGRDVRNESLAVTEAYDFGQNSGSYTSLSNRATISAAGSLDIMAGRDLSDLAGQLSAGSANLTAGQNISFGTIKTGSTYQSQISGYTEKDSSITHQLSQISTTGDLKIAATGDLKLNGTQVAIGTAGSGTGQLLAGGTIDVAAVTNEVNTSVQNDPRSKQYDKQVRENQTVVGAGVTATGSLMVGAGLIETGAINVTGSSLVAGEALKLTATDSVNIVSTQEQHLSDTALTRTSSSFLKSKTTQQADYVASSQAVGSALSGKTIEVSAGKDINVLGSAIAGDGDVSLAAVGSVNIWAATSTLTEQHHTQVKESGFLSGDGFGISYGTRTTTTDQSRDATTQSGQSRSMVGSLGGNLDIVAGDAIKVSGSDLAAGLNMNLDGRSVTIDPGQDSLKGKFEQTKVQDGLTLAVGGSVVSAIQTFQSLSSAASQSKDTRVQALAAATAAMAAKNVANDIAQNGINVSLSLTVGHSESQYTQTTSNLLNSGSLLNAGNDITIRATGGGKDSNISAIGSDLRATGNIMLKADNQANLLAAQDLESQHSDSKSVSADAGIGASIGTNGMSYGFTANASVGRGTVDGDGTTQANTHVAAGSLLTITSGGDTNVKGAVASGSQVVADVKGNLNIESLQDKATFDSKNQSVSVGGTVGVGASFSGSVNQSKAHNDYASVQEQSGIRTGDGGFQVTVGGNTDLKGGVISSSTAGVAASSLVTATLTHSDIANHATSSASGIGMGGGLTVDGNGGNAGAKDEGGIKLTDVSRNGSGVSLPSVNAVFDNTTGITQSGIGAGTLVIADGVAQREVTGQGATQVPDGLNRDVVTGSDAGGVINNFDPNATAAALAISSEFAGRFASVAAPVAANLIGDIGRAKEKSAQDQAYDYERLAADAATRGDSETAAAFNIKAADAQSTAEAWGDNGLNRLALHAAAQGLIGGIAAGNTGALSSISGVAGGNLGQQLGEKLGAAEADRHGLQGQDKETFIDAYQQTLASIGGAVAGLATASGSRNGLENALTATVQAATTAGAVDAFNRRLHPGDYKVAKTLAAISGGKYSEQEIQAALRYAGLRDGSGSVIVPEGTTEVFVNSVDIKTGTTLQNTLSSDPYLPLGFGDKTTQLESAPVRPANDLISYIVANTGGPTSPYVLTLASTYSIPLSLPPAPDGTARATMPVDGSAYYPLVATCPAATCTNGDSIAFGIQDPGTSAYLEAISTRNAKYLNIGTGVLGLGGTIIRGASAVAEIAASQVQAVEVALSSARLAASTPKNYGVTFFGDDILPFYGPSKATIGNPSGAPSFFMPVEDAALVKNAHDAAVYTGMAPSAQRAYLSSNEIYGFSFPTNGLNVVKPTVVDAAGWPHFLEGGYTAVRLEGANAGFMVTPVREFITSGSNAVPAGSVLFKIGPNGEWIPLRKW
jgi:filamentous hemagglutinin